MTFSLDIDSLPTLPVIAGQIMECLNNPNSSVQDVAEIVLRDQSLSAKILKLVNSAFYGFPKRIGTISHAISILGFETVRGLVLGVSILDTFRVQEFDLLEFWEHSILTASLMSLLAERWFYPRRDEAFTVGLIHDVGKLVFMLKAPEAYHQVLSFDLPEQRSAETRLMGLDHAEAGARMAEIWNFPAHYIQAIALHHQKPELPLENPDLHSMAYLANLIDHLLEAEQPSAEQLKLLSLLELELEELQEYMTSIQQEVSEFLRTLSPNA